MNLAAGLAITIETFDPNEQSLCRDSSEHSTFFSPVAIEKFKEYERDLDQPGAKEAVERLGEWYKPDPQEWPEVSYHIARELCHSLGIVFDEIPYKKNGHGKLIFLSDATTFREMYVTTPKEAFDFINTNYHHSQQVTAFTDPRGFDATECWSDEWRSQPLNVWAAADKPHMMACMAHHYVHDDDTLFVSEIEVMVALMIVRLANGSFPSHNIIPVMLFSYTGDKRGRILQAYMSAKSLVIRKSDFFDFSSRVDTHLDTFTRYMMGPLRGETQILDRPDIKSNFAEKNYNIGSLEAAGFIK